MVKYGIIFDDLGMELLIIVRNIVKVRKIVIVNFIFFFDLMGIMK